MMALSEELWSFSFLETNQRERERERAKMLHDYPMPTVIQVRGTKVACPAEYSCCNAIPRKGGGAAEVPYIGQRVSGENPCVL